MDTVECVVDCKCTLGEGIYWDAREACLWWVDVPMPSRIYRYSPISGKLDSWEMSEMVMSVAVRENHPGLVIASHGGLNFFDPNKPELVRVVAPESMKPFNRSNDAAADARGRFWLGTMQNNIAPDGSSIDIIGNTGALYRIDPDLRVNLMESNIGIANTVCWSPDHRTMYFADTMTGSINAYDFDLDAGVISNKREFAQIDRGHPDGSTVDAEGFLWNARWDGSCIARFAPDGSVDRIIEIPAAQVTNCVFGGSDLSTLYITTARFGLTVEQLANTPDAGSIFALSPGVQGLPDNRFAG